MEIITKAEAKQKGLKRYFTGKPCKRGHISERIVSDRGCLMCRVQYCVDNKEKIATREAQYRVDNKASCGKYAAQYYADNKEKFAQYRENNKEKLDKYYAQYRKDNPIPVFVRSSLNRIIGNWKGGRSKAEELCGYTIEQLKKRIEFNFKDGMNWENRGEWHIDHKKPVARFIAQGITDPAIINALSNLQPLWASDNQSKGAKFSETKGARNDI